MEADRERLRPDAYQARARWRAALRRSSACVSRKGIGYSFDAHVRQRAWWDVFSGACGHTYGNHSVWQMYAPGRKPINGPLLYWNEAILRPGAAQMQYVRALIEARPYLSRVPDLSLVLDPLSGSDRIAATRGDGYALVYSAQGADSK